MPSVVEQIILVDQRQLSDRQAMENEARPASQERELLLGHLREPRLPRVGYQQNLCEILPSPYRVLESLPEGGDRRTAGGKGVVEL